MRSPSLLKALALTGVLFSCWGCSLVEFNGRGSSEPPSHLKSAPEEDVFRADASQQSIDLKEAISVLASYEDGPQKPDELKPGTLVALSRLCFIIGESVGRDERKQFYEKGLLYAKHLCLREPCGVEGHYWVALNLCGLAETSRAGLALSLVPVIVGELELALSSDKTYDQAGPHRVIGRIYCEAPSWPLSEGDINKSLHHLRKAVEIAPGNSTNHLYLAETLIQLGMGEEAQRELESALASMQHTLLSNDLEDDHKQAARLMAQIKGDGQSIAETQKDHAD